MNATPPAGNPALEPIPVAAREDRTVMPLLVGLRAAKANLIPGLFLQGLMLVIVLAYFRMPQARPWFDQLGVLKLDFGYAFTAVSAVIAGALLPELFKWCVLQRRLPVRSDAGDFLFAAGFYVTSALCVDCLYRWQTVWFGTGASWVVLGRKILVDQFVYNPIFSAPFAVVGFTWKNHDYSLRAWRETLDARAFGQRVLATLIATWFVWIPVVAVLYSLPPLLQIPVYCLALCFWALMLTYIHAKRKSVPHQATKKNANASNT